jgi:hypothetical protein
VNSDEYDDFDDTPVGNLSLFISPNQLLITADALLDRLADTDEWWNDNRLEDLLPTSFKQLVCNIVWLHSLLELDMAAFSHLKEIHFILERSAADAARQINWDQEFQESQPWTLLQKKLQIACFCRYDDESNPILLGGRSEPVIRFVDLIEDSEQEDSEEEDSGGDDSEDDNLGDEDANDEDADDEEQADETVEDIDYTKRFGN